MPPKKNKAKKKQSAETGGNQITGNIGLHYTCMRLSAMGLNAIPTARNAVGVDVLANNREHTGKTVAIQVKTISGKFAVPLGKPGRPILGDFWVVVAAVDKIRIGEEPLCLVIGADQVRRHQAGGSFRFLPLAGFDPDCVDAWEKIEAAIDPKFAGKYHAKARAKSAVGEILGQADGDASAFVRNRDALLVHFVYAKGLTFRKVYAMEARDVASMPGIPERIKAAAKEVMQRHGKKARLICKHDGKPFRRWEVLAGMGSCLKRRWMSKE